MSFSDSLPVTHSVPGPNGGELLFGIPCLEDNLAWGLADTDGGVLLVDVPEAAPVDRFLRENNLRLERVLITHGHRDHTGGLHALLRSHPADVWAHPRLGLKDATAIPADGGVFTWKDYEIRVMDTSGHSDCDTSFYLPGPALCFCGDTVFAGGCGRLFAGPPARMWASLLRLRALPDNTLLCVGHDYALENYRFGSRTFPDMPVFRETLKTVEAEADAGRIFAPVTVGGQSRSNPMLMADHPETAAALGMTGAPPEEIFAEIRSRRSAG
ncbi:MAG: hydroxyacylglutathione hydrolase [Verrucomicrobia bacterium]|nr:hydroxyacylglutathione hydrolase [Verrucomicrobiota bacterium]MCH8529071.1 hydroxyacylglutathione hydrolase [Kiritimatiellia bacterium]